MKEISPVAGLIVAGTLLGSKLVPGSGLAALNPPTHGTKAGSAGGLNTAAISSSGSPNEYTSESRSRSNAFWL